MYQHFFNLERMPFNTTPDTRFFFDSAQHQEALSSLLYAVNERKGFTLLTGEIGAGKTTVCRAFLNRLDPNTKVAVITNTRLTERQLLQAICEEYGLWIPGNVGKVTLFNELNSFLVDQYRQNVNVALIVDEAQNLRPEVLEEIRLISNLETECDKLIQIVLMGQPELRDIVELPELKQLKQRISMRYHLYPLSEREVQAYVFHRLKVAGADGTLKLSRGALKAVFDYSGGIPRVINIVCDNALLLGFVQETHRITEELVREVIRDLEGDRRRLVQQTTQGA
jgi:general secretion pathway protein A